MRLPFASRGLFARFAAAALLWAPLLLWLVWWSTPVDTLRVHLLTSLVLALIGAGVLRTLFVLPSAPPGKGRYRVVPRAPFRPMLVAAIGVSSLGWAGWRTVVLPLDVMTFTAVASGSVALWVAIRGRADPLWGTWMELVGDVLHVHCPRAEDWTVPLSHARTLHRRTQDGSFLLETPWQERDVFVPSPAARARYAVSNHEELFALLAARIPVEETQTLLGVLYRREGRKTSAP